MPDPVGRSATVTDVPSLHDLIGTVPSGDALRRSLPAWALPPSVLISSGLGSSSRRLPHTSRMRRQYVPYALRVPGVTASATRSMYSANVGISRGTGLLSSSSGVMPSCVSRTRTVSNSARLRAEGVAVMLGHRREGRRAAAAWRRARGSAGRPADHARGARPGAPCHPLRGPPHVVPRPATAGDLDWWWHAAVGTSLDDRHGRRDLNRDRVAGLPGQSLQPGAVGEPSPDVDGGDDVVRAAVVRPSVQLRHG